MSYETDEMTYILCHTEDEIFVFYIMKTTTGFSSAILWEVNKTEKGLKYNSISTFSSTDKTLVIIYSHLSFAIAVIRKESTDIEKQQFLDSDKKPLDIHDAKFSTFGPYVFIIVKGKGFYAYNYKRELIASIVHPHLTQIDKVSNLQKDSNVEFIGVFIDQEQKDIREVLVELLFAPFGEKKILVNKAFTTNGLKFQTNFIASNNFYVLTTKDALYLLPAKQKSRIFTVGSKVSITAEDNITVGTLKTNKGYLYVINDKTKNRVISEKSKRETKEFSCIFSAPNEYTVELFIYTNTLTAMDITATFEVSVGGFPLWIILLACGAAVLIIIGVAVWCYIKKRNANQAANAQLL
jgi:hypothetical protein